MRDEKEGRSKQDVTDSYRPSSVGIKTVTYGIPGFSPGFAIHMQSAGRPGQKQ